MAGAMVGVALLSASLEVLLDRIASREFISFFSKRKFEHRLDKLKITLLTLQAVLDDAEDKQITSKHVKAWLEELQHVVYHADDLLDEITTKALRDKLEADQNQSQSQSQSSTTQVGFNQFFHPIKQSLLRINRSILTSTYLSNEALQYKLKEVISKLEWFVEQKTSLNLRENVGAKQSQRQETTSLIDESDVYGRNNDKEKIMELLLSDNIATRNQIHVIPIVGMGGIGKTTLAQFVFNDVKVKEEFHIKSWVCVSDAFDICMITKKILDDVTASNNDINSLDHLQIKLKESLIGKKFLIVLDDIWNHNYNDWDCLRRPFSAGAQESRIIVTTRIDEVGSAMGTVPSHYLEKMSFEDCWLLFAKHAFGSEDYVAHSNLERIGKQIVEKCKGLPLAVKSLGGLLRSKLDIDDWNNILKSEIWDLESDISPALRLSYHYLPSHLKRCFTYCSKFPKGYRFEREKLVLLWIAEDLVQQPKSNKLVEDEGNYYFCQLLSRSFFQRLSVSNSYFVMHDLIHDLAQHISGKFCFRLDDDKPLDHICEKVHHFSYLRGKYDAFEKFKVVNELKYLRTFISFPRLESFSFLSNKVLYDMLPTLRCLRVISLSGYEIFELPQSIKNLIHLRYLDLSWTKIGQLPDSVTTLYNLQTLDLSNCSKLTKLPVNMGKLMNLRHLDVRGTAITEMPTQISRLKDLRHLTNFVVGKNTGSEISGLKELYRLQGKLSILGLQNVVSDPDASEAKLKDKKYLEGLVLEWDGDTNDSQKERDILDKLQPHEVLKDLSIIGYGGTRFPDWLDRAHSYCNMVSLKLIRCGNCYSLPSFGQLPALKYLRIERMMAITKVGQEFYGNGSSIKPFQSLETLNFEGMLEWEEWHALGAGEFSRLSELSMVDCPKLTGELPDHFPSLRKLEIFKCQGLLSNQVGLLLRGLPSLQELKMSKMTNLTELPPQLQHLSSLQELMISDISNLMKLPSQLQHLSSLQKLEISGMPNLKELPPELCRLTELERLKIEECSSLVSFPDVGFPPMLKTLEIKRCKALQSLTVSEGMNMMCINNCLQELRVSDCSSLQVSFPIGDLPVTLKTLDIWNCSSLEFPSSEETEYNYYTSIEDLSIKKLDLLKSLSLDLFPKLRYLKIWGCVNFETLSIPDEHQNLIELHMYNCPKLVSFPHGDEGLPAPNLTSFRVEHCENLKSLPQQMHTLLPSLQELMIHNCPEIESFQDGGLPSNLRELKIQNCRKLVKGRTSWGLRRLPSLEGFSISRAEYAEEEEEEEEEVLESFPEEWLLPTTLTSLAIHYCLNMKSLNHNGLQHLTSLTSLYIWVCPKLQSLPEEGLPNSISFLSIFHCPLLKPRCQREKGEDWPKISRIRHIQLDEEDIVNLE